MNSLDRSATLIANKQLRFAGRTYSPGDKFDYQRLSYAQRRKVIRLMDGAARKIAELTPASMTSALKHRTNPRPPRGFTLAGLLGLGILTEQQLVDFGWQLENREVDNEEGQEYTPPEGSWQVYAEGVETDEDKADADYVWILPYRSGAAASGRGATRYFVHDANGLNLNGAGSISGKDNAEDWGRDYLAKKERATGDNSPWKDFPDSFVDWSDEQVEVFDHWYEGIEADSDISNEPESVQQLVKERRTAADAETARAAEDDRLAGMSEADSKDFIDSMSDADLLSFVQSQRPGQDDSLAQLSRIALNDIAAEIIADKVKEKQNDGDVQSGSGGDEG